MQRKPNTWLNCLTMCAVAAVTLLSGCGGGGDTQGPSGPIPGGHIAGGAFVGRSYVSSNLPLASGRVGALSLSVADNGTITGALAVTAGAGRGLAPRRDAPLDIATMHLLGYFNGTAGTFTLNFVDGTPGNVSGALPAPPTITGGSFTVVIRGTTYGPYPFGYTPPPVAAAGKYDIAVIQPLPGATYSQASGLNDSGTVVGASDVNNGNNSHSFLWKASTGTQDLNAPGSDSGAADINNSGQVVGQFTLPGDRYHQHAYVIDSAGLRDIGFPQGYNNLVVAGITEAGEIIVTGGVLTNDGSGSEGSFFYANNAFMAVGPSGNRVELFGYNKAGFVYGDVVPPTGPVTNYFSYANGNTTSLPASLFADVQSFVSARGVAVGPSGEILAGKKSTGHAAIFNNGSVTDLGVPGLVTGLNKRGEAIVSGSGGAYYWTAAGGAVNLNTLIDPASGFTIDSAVAINSSGQIAVSAHSKQYHAALGVALLLTPR